MVPCQDLAKLLFAKGFYLIFMFKCCNNVHVIWTSVVSLVVCSPTLLQFQADLAKLMNKINISVQPSSLFQMHIYD